MARIKFEFNMKERRFRELLSDDARAPRTDGITVESMAARVLDGHDPADGYIRWSIFDATEHDIEWSEPQPSTDYSWFYEELENNPGKWAVYPGSYPAAYAYARRHDEFEARGEGSGEDRVVKMRYRGEDDE